MTTWRTRRPAPAGRSPGNSIDVDPGRQELLHRRGAAHHRCEHRQRPQPPLAAQYGRFAYATVTGTEHVLPLRPGDQHGRDHDVRVHHQARARAPKPAPSSALYPHQWKALIGATPDSPALCLAARADEDPGRRRSSSRTSMTFHGVLPEVPAVADSSGADGPRSTATCIRSPATRWRSRRRDTYWAGKGTGPGGPDRRDR